MTFFTEFLIFYSFSKCRYMALLNDFENDEFLHRLWHVSMSIIFLQSGSYLFVINEVMGPKWVSLGGYKL